MRKIIYLLIFFAADLAISKEYAGNNGLATLYDRDELKQFSRCFHKALVGFWRPLIK